MLGDVVKKSRLEKGWTLISLQKAIDDKASTTYLSRLESNKEIPSRDMVVILAKALDLNENDLLKLAIEGRINNLTKVTMKKYTNQI